MIYLGAPPTKAYDNDAGWDLAVDGDHTILANAPATIPLQTRLLAPQGCWLLLVGRSSTFRNRGLMINIGVIDPSYTGPLFAVCRNLNQYPLVVGHGERVVQAIPIPAIYTELNEVTRMPITDRGENGFGSSGH